MRLNFVEGPRAGEKIEIETPEPNSLPLTFGRSRESSVTIDSPHLSRRHAELYADPSGRLLIRDAGSVNGTIVNNRPATASEPIALSPGDQIRVGDTLFIYEGLVGPMPERDNQPFVLKPTAPLATEHELSAGQVFYYLLLRTGQRYLFDGEEAIVGRGQGNDIVIDSPSMSRQHAKLQKTPGGVYVSDLGSTNKTFVNEIRADFPILLNHNDVVRFGDVVADFRIENQRQTNFFNITDQTILEGFTDGTRRDFSLGGFDHQATNVSGPGLEQLETALNLEVRIIGRKGRQASDALPELNRFPDLRPTPVNPQSYTQPEVARLEGVYVTEGQGRAAQLMLNDVRLGLRQGELVAVIGPSGSGKSELVQVMAARIPADRGKAFIMGRELPTYETAGRRLDLESDRDLVRWRARNIGYLNSGQLLDMRRPAFEQVMQAMELAGIGRDGRERQERAFERLNLVGLTDPEVCRLKPGDLNRTEKQLVQLARALACDPPLLLCDEPLGNLNSPAASYVFSLLQRQVAAGKTVLMVTQDQMWARNASRIIEILDGAIVGSLS